MEIGSGMTEDFRAVEVSSPAEKIFPFHAALHKNSSERRGSGRAFVVRNDPHPGVQERAQSRMGRFFPAFQSCIRGSKTCLLGPMNRTTVPYGQSGQQTLSCFCGKAALKRAMCFFAAARCAAQASRRGRHQTDTPTPLQPPDTL